MDAPQANWIQRGQALHLQHGPIDLVIRCEGTQQACRSAYDTARTTFTDVLPQLVAELDNLRTELSTESSEPTGAIARRMYVACAPFLNQRVTPMAAVAGAVADHVLEAMLKCTNLDRAWINNGGDIAVHLANGKSFECGMITHMGSSVPDGKITLAGGDGIGGVATSGRATHGQGGRSFSLGIADSVTVLATTAARADVAATLIANAVDLPDHAHIRRVSATDIDPDSDLGSRKVVVSVDALANSEINQALTCGSRVARAAQQEGLIHSAVLTLEGIQEIVDGCVNQTESQGLNRPGCIAQAASPRLCCKQQNFRDNEHEY